MAAEHEGAVCARLLDATARELRAGSSVATAIGAGASRERDVLPFPLADALAAHARGRGLADALTSAHLVVDRRRGDPGAVHLTLSVLCLAAAEGGMSAEPLDRAAATLRERLAARSDAEAQAAAARMSAALLTVAPIAFSAGACLLDDDVRRILVSTPLGWATAASGLALNLLGRHWMRRIVASATESIGWA